MMPGWWDAAARTREKAALSVGPWHRRDQLERAVEPWAETLGQEVVRLPGRGRRRVRAGVVEAELEGEHRDGDDDHPEQADRGPQPGLPLDRARPPVPAAGGDRLGLRAGFADPPALPAAENPRADEAEQRRQQGE